MIVNNSHIQREIYPQFDQLIWSGKVIPENTSGYFEIGLSGAIGAGTYHFHGKNGKIFDVNNSFIYTYDSSSSFTFEHRIDETSNVYDFWINGKPMALNQTYNNSIPYQYIYANSDGTSVNFESYLSGDAPTLSGVQEIFFSGIEFDGRTGQGQYVNLGAYDVDILDVSCPSGSGLIIESFDVLLGTVPASETGTFTIVATDEYFPSGSNIDITFHTYSYPQTISYPVVNSGISDFSNVELALDSTLITTVFESGNLFGVGSVESNVAAGNVFVKLEYSPSFYNFNPEVFATGTGEGHFTGFLLGTGKLFSSEVTGNITGASAIGTLGGCNGATGFGYTDYFADGEVSYTYSTLGTGFISGAYATGLIQGTEYGTVIQNDPGSGSFLFNKRVTAPIVNYFVSSLGIGTGTETLTGWLHNVEVHATGFVSRFTTGTMFGYCPAAEGIKFFTGLWDLQTGESLTGDFFSFRDNAWYNAGRTIYEAPGTNIHPLGLHEIFIKVAYNNGPVDGYGGFYGYGEDTATLTFGHDSLFLPEKSVSVEITGSNVDYRKLTDYGF